MKCAITSLSRSTMLVGVLIVLLATACSKEDVSPLGGDLPTLRSATQQGQNATQDVKDDAGSRSLRSDEVDGADPDAGGISDDGNDEGDRERNKKGKS